MTNYDALAKVRRAMMVIKAERPRFEVDDAKVEIWAKSLAPFPEEQIARAVQIALETIKTPYLQLAHIREHLRLPRGADVQRSPDQVARIILSDCLFGGQKLYDPYHSIERNLDTYRAWRHDGGTEMTQPRSWADTHGHGKPHTSETLLRFLDKVSGIASYSETSILNL